MSVETLTPPITVEDVANVIKRWGQAEWQRVLDLVPALREMALTKNKEEPKVSAPPARRGVRTLEEAEAQVTALRAELMTKLDHKPISGNQLFLGGLTLNEHFALPEDEQDRISNEAEAAAFDWDELEEVEVSPDVLLAG